MDYRKLCVELFGTDDEATLRKIAAEYRKKNTRNAGRKRKIADEDIHKMRAMRNAGTSMQELARTFGLSRQTVERYLNTAAGDGCTMRITYMFRRQPCTVIDVDFLDQKVVIQNKTEHPTWNDFENFLRDRCFPQTRGNCKELLQEMDLTDYDPLKIVEKTRGRLADDEMWLRLRYLPRKEIIYASH